jgi:hypothetical protein
MKISGQVLESLEALEILRAIFPLILTFPLGGKELG